MGAWGANIINFPANLAYNYFQRVGRSAATEWLLKAFQRVKARGVHAETAFHELLWTSLEKDKSSEYIKRESSAETTTSGSSPGSSESQRSLPSTVTTFVYEDPSTSYYDASNDPD